MQDPTTHAATVAAAAPTVAVATTIAGLALWPFGVAFIFACCALIYLDRMILKDAVLSIVGSTLIGGSVAQLSAAPALLIAANFFPALHDWAADSQITMTAIIAIIIGLFCQKAMPALLRRTDKLGG